MFHVINKSVSIIIFDKIFEFQFHKFCQDVFATGRKVILPDNDASNGVVHMLNQVIYPVPTKNIVAEASTTPELSTLVYAVIRGNLQKTLTGIWNWYHECNIWNKSISWTENKSYWFDCLKIDLLKKRDKKSNIQWIFKEGSMAVAIFKLINVLKKKKWILKAYLFGFSFYEIYSLWLKISYFKAYPMDNVVDIQLP